MPRALHVSALVAALLFTSGCCGGYSVVRTTIHDHAELRAGADEPVRGNAEVLHYSRLGEPANSCGSSVRYAEALWIQVPALDPGRSHTLGAPGVVASYTRAAEGSEPEPARSIAGTVTIVERTADGVVASLEVQISLRAGEVVALDDEYEFHTLQASRRGVRHVAEARGAVATHECVALSPSTARRR